MLFNNLEISNQLFNAYESNEPFLTVEEYFKILSFLGLCIGIILWCLNKENNPKNHGFESFCSLWTSQKAFFSRRQLRFFLFFVLFYRVGFAPAETLANVYLVQNGLKREILSNLSTF